MSASHQPTAYGRIFAPREDWLARAPAEEIRNPGLAIIDTHHHLWSEPGRYLVDDLLADTASGHNVEATVYIDCRQSYRKDGPVELRSVGEVEYVVRLAAQADANRLSKTRVAAGIVGYADLTLGERVEPVLAALIEAGVAAFAECAMRLAGTRTRSSATITMARVRAITCARTSAPDSTA
jgi:L-fuconolactonase